MGNVCIMLHWAVFGSLHSTSFSGGQTTKSIVITLVVFHRDADVIIVNGVSCFIAPYFLNANLHCLFYTQFEGIFIICTPNFIFWDIINIVMADFYFY